MEPETKVRGDQSPKAADQRARETAGVLKEEALAPPLRAQPCSSLLLLLLLHACAGCLGLRGYCSDDDGPKPAADDDDDLKPADDDDDDPKPAADGDDDDAAAPAVAETPKEGAGGAGGDEAASEVDEVNNPTPPDTPRGGTGDDGGKHH